METITSNLYEGMFLIDAARAGSDWDGVISTIKKILGKAEAEIVSIRKWDDRKLAYDIKRQSRGVYILCYFRVDGEKIQDIEKNVKLSEQIIRVLILNAEQLTEEDIEKDTPATKTEKEEQKAVEEIPAKETEEQQSTDQDSVEEKNTEQDGETEDTKPEPEQDGKTEDTKPEPEQDGKTEDAKPEPEKEQETDQDGGTEEIEQEPEEKIQGSEVSDSEEIKDD